MSNIQRTVYWLVSLWVTKACFYIFTHVLFGIVALVTFMHIFFRIFNATVHRNFNSAIYGCSVKNCSLDWNVFIPLFTFIIDYYTNNFARWWNIYKYIKSWKFHIACFLIWFFFYFTALKFDIFHVYWDYIFMHILQYNSLFLKEND